MKKKNILYGLYFIAAALFILLNGLGILGDLNIFKVIAVIVIIPVFISGIMNKGFARIVFSIALGAVLFKKELGISGISVWSVLAAALLLSIGFHMIFPGKEKKLPTGADKQDFDNIVIKSKGNGVVKYIDSDNFTSAVIKSSFSGIKLFFDKAMLNSKGAVIDVDMKCSGLEIYVPKTWNVIENVDCAGSGIKKCGECIDVVNAPVLKICGRAVGSGITIMYV